MTSAAPGPLFVGIDVGSMTVKVVVIEASSPLVVRFESYRRHQGDVYAALRDSLREATPAFESRFVCVCMSGSAAMHIAAVVGIPFVQEVVSCGVAIREVIPGGVDAAIELGGEDAKILRFGPAPERVLLDATMNTACASGTGSFIDQMAVLLDTDSSGLDALASRHEKIFPIASRCGVFAKTDIQPLLSEGVRKEDIAASVLQAVVNQNIAALAAGKPIAGRVALLGGPMHFLPQLRATFARTLRLPADAVVSPDRSHILVAIGAALTAAGRTATASSGSASHVPFPADFLVHRLARIEGSPEADRARAVARLPPLFESEAALADFRQRHSRAIAARADISSAAGPVFLGVDAGSTTLKLVLADSDGRLLHQFYAPHRGAALKMAVSAVAEAQRMLPSSAFIARASCTGYGEFLMKSALSADESVVETVAHVTAARHFLPSADFVLDIGGQDMKCISTDSRGVVREVVLNEACSSGCGSFIQTLSDSLGITVAEFAAAGLRSRAPLDLGTRCTVFMGSRIKQAQKDGTSIEDVSAGMALSVVKNALFKVARIRSPESLRESHVVVQGGTFFNDSTLRAMEVVLGGVPVVRPDVAGLMGALGAALTARQSWRAGDPSARSSLSSPDVLDHLAWENTTKRCGKCSNNCLMNVHRFSNGASHCSGNRCERGLVEDPPTPAAAAAASSAPSPGARSEPLPNLFRWQRERVFKYTPLKDPPRGQIGLPRVLDFCDRAPFWTACLGALGFQVLFSPESSEALWERGSQTLTVEAACLPSKVVHGHVLSLMDRKIPLIFLPCIPHGIDREVPKSGMRNHYSCPLVNSYSDVILNACGLREHPTIRFVHAPLPLHDRKVLARRLCEEFSKVSPPALTVKQCEAAVAAGFASLERYYAEVAEKGRETLEFMERTGTPGALIACRPYHLDPYLVNSVPNLVVSAGRCVLTVESLMPLWRNEALPAGFPEVEIYGYDTRIAKAAAWAARIPRLAFVHLLSFGCGIAGNTDDAVRKAMDSADHPFCTIKLDQKSSIGAVRVRLRSLFAAMESRLAGKREAPVPAPSITPNHSMPCMLPTPEELKKYRINRTASLMRKDRVHLVWSFSPEHGDLWARGMAATGTKIALMPAVEPKLAADLALRYVNADLCFGGWLLVGMYLHFLLRGGFDPDKTDVLWQDWGGACSCGWLAHVIKRALISAGLPQVQVTSLSYSGLVNPGMDTMQAIRTNMGTVLGELLQTVVYRTRPYEVTPGSTDSLRSKWLERLCEYVSHGNPLSFSRVCREVVTDFDALPLTTEEHSKPRVALLGTMSKADAWTYSHIVQFLEKEEGCEVVALDILDYAVLGSMNEVSNEKFLSSSFGRRFGARAQKFAVELLRDPMSAALRASKRFTAPLPAEQSHRKALEIVSPSHHEGEGWVMPAHIIHALESGVSNIVAFTSFLCVSIHIGLRGTLPAIKQRYPQANICVIDFDSGTAFQNQLNRIKLMLGCIPGRPRPPPEIICAPADIEDIGKRASCESCPSHSSCSVATPAPAAQACPPATHSDPIESVPIVEVVAARASPTTPTRSK